MNTIKNIIGKFRLAAAQAALDLAQRNYEMAQCALRRRVGPAAHFGSKTTLCGFGDHSSGVISTNAAITQLVAKQ
jgi:hypothetical protein